MNRLPLPLLCAVPLALAVSCSDSSSSSRPRDEKMEVRNEARLSEMQRRLVDYDKEIGLKRNRLDELQARVDDLRAEDARTPEVHAFMEEYRALQAEILRLEDGAFDLDDSLLERTD